MSIKTIAVAAAVAVSMNAMAQAPAVAVLHNVVQLSASGSVQAEQDWLVMTLAATIEGKDAAATQAELQKMLNAALGKAKPQAREDALEVRTGSFSLYPRYNDKGATTGWRGQAELVLQGRDFERVTRAASLIDTMVVSNVGFELSRQAMNKVRSEAQAQAIANFRQQAQTLTSQFGFTSYTLREVQVNSHHSGPNVPIPQMMGKRMDAMAASAPIPVEAGKADVEVNISGSIQMQ